jgi:hypothetical protein
MNNGTADAESAVGPANLKHWLLQILPPVLAFLILLMTANGPSLVFLVGFLVLPVLFSLISIIARLICFHRKKRFLVRPLLTIAVFMAIFAIGNWTYQHALEQTIDAARLIHQQCNRDATCPQDPAGWQRDGSILRRDDTGSWLSYIALYHYDSASFSIRVHQGPDLGDVISGGVNLPFTVARYIE